MVIIKQGQMDAWVSFKRGEKKKKKREQGTLGFLPAVE